MRPEDYQANDLAGCIVCEALSNSGVTEVVLSPGSRSTPLTFAFAMDERFNDHVVLDERSAAFYALGRAKATQQTVVLLCTSGSAAANYLPAIVEAHYSQTPLLVITADRPLTEQFCHAGQTILQNGIYSNFVRHEQQVELPQNHSTYLKYLKGTIRNALEKTHFPSKGVVHLNVPFTGVLVTTLNRDEYKALKESITEEYSSAYMPFDSRACNSDLPSFENQHNVSEGLQRKCIAIMGPDYLQDDNLDALKIKAATSILGIPLLIDGLSASRNATIDGESDNTIWSYEWLLNAQMGIRDELKPDMFIQIGNLPTSKSLRQSISEWGCKRMVVRRPGDFDYRDPSFSPTTAEMSVAEFEKFAHSIANPNETTKPFLKSWLDFQDKCKTAITEACETEPTTTVIEPVCCNHLPEIITKPCDLFVANSTIVRDVENFYFGGKDKIRKVFSNRGANGIDGTVSTAFGACEVDVPLICLIGDLSFIHDAGGLNLASQFLNNKKPAKRNVCFVLFDNNGGGIFEHLPISNQNPPFETHFATPQDVNLSKLIEAYGIQYQSIPTLKKLELSLRSFLEGENEIVCLHLKTDRKQSLAFRKSTLATIKKTLTIEL